MKLNSTKKELANYFDNIKQIDEKQNIIRCIRKYKGKPYQFFYFDFYQDLNDIKLDEYVKKIISTDYYSNAGSIQWNFYLAFILNETLKKKLKNKIKENIENDADFARKYIILDNNLENWLNNKYNPKVQIKAKFKESLTNIWIKKLEDNKLIWIYNEKKLNLDKGIKKIISGRYFYKEEKREIYQESVNDPIIDNINHISHIKLNKYRTILNGKEFVFKKINLITDPNGFGKTSLLEAIEYFICGSNLRNPHSRQQQDISINFKSIKKEIKYISVLLNTNANMGQNPEELYRILINVLFEQKKYHETIYYAEKLLKKNYHQSHLHSIIAEAYRNIGDFKKARNHFIRAVNDNRKIIEYHYGLSMVLWQMKAYKELQKELDIILYKNPKDEIARYYYALVLAKTGADKTTTLSHLQVEVKKHGPDPELMCSLGTQYLKLDLPELAAGWFERTLKLDPACKEALLSLISISAKTGETIKQFSYLQQYLKVFPNDIPVKKKYIKLLLKTGRYGEAAKQIMEILPIETENMKLKETLAVCYRKEGNFFDALLIYMELLRKNPKSGRLLQAVSFCKIQLGATEDAIRLLEKASSFVKNNSTLLLTLGALYYRTQNYEEALRVLRKVTEVSPRSWQAYEGLSRVYNRLGNKIFADKFKERANEYKILIS